MRKRLMIISMILFAILLFGCSADTTNTQDDTSTVPYTQHIARADQSIYDGPSYDACFVGTIEQQGTYTIVEEAEDSEGNVWGKLKSGIGWVDLTQIQSNQYASDWISVNYADETLLKQNNYIYCDNDDAYAVSVAVRAYDVLKDVELFAIALTDEGEQPGDTIISLPELMEDTPLVAELSFPGDMSTYGIRFVDTTEQTHLYHIYISGRNGALILVEVFD